MNIPESVSRFLEGKNLAVAGVSRKAGHTGNVVFRKLKKAGYNVVPLNPHAAELEGVRCYPDVTSVPVRIDGVVVTAHPRVSEEIITQCARAGVRRVWLHRSFGKGSVSEKAVRLAGEQNIECIAGGCPLMFCDPVDFPHKCMRWWLQKMGNVPV